MGIAAAPASGASAAGSGAGNAGTQAGADFAAWAGNLGFEVTAQEVSQVSQSAIRTSLQQSIQSGLITAAEAGVIQSGLETAMGSAVDLAIANYEDPRLLPFAARRLEIA